MQCAAAFFAGCLLLQFDWIKKNQDLC